MSVEITTLANGLRVASDTMDTVETVSLGAWIEAGTRDEGPDVNGISHVLEHMAFKGTGRRDAREIAEAIENVGGQINAYTAREHTAYYAKVLKDDLALAVDIIADILQHSVMDGEELSREQDVIVQEINQSFDTPDDIIFDHFQATAYPDQAMGRPVLGTADLVRAMNPDRLLRYMAAHYTGANMVLAAAGNLDHGDLVRIAEDAFDALPDAQAGGREKTDYRGGDYREARDVEQVHVLIGMDGMAFDDPDFHAASVFSTLLGGGMSSRLFQEVREKRGLAYSIYSYLAGYTDGGMLAVYAGTGRDEAAQLVPIVMDEVEKLAQAVPADEITRARAQVKAHILMSREGTSSRAEQLARQLMVYRRPLPVDEVVAKIDAVDEQALKRVAGRLLASAPTLAALGPAAGVDRVQSPAA